jgi:hypothetical protein
VVDVGAADGDMGFFFESLGASVEFVETPAPNSNRMAGISYMRDALKSVAPIHAQDIDFDFDLLRQYDLAIFQGVIYHLRNPYGALLHIAMHAQRMVCNTRVFTHLPDGTYVENSAICYLWDRREGGAVGASDFVAMTPAGLRVMLKRAGWKVLDEVRVGAVGESDPLTKDERMFCYCERVPNWRDLRVHLDF